MKILVKIGKSRKENQTPHELALALFNRIDAAYLDQSIDKEAYLLNPEKSENAAEDLSLIDGRENPDTVKAEALAWNGTLEENFSRALADLESAADRKPGNKTEWLGVPSSLIYAMKKAAMALDDDFYHFAESAILVNRYDALACVLPKDAADDIMAHPEDYAIVHVWPK